MANTRRNKSPGFRGTNKLSQLPSWENPGGLVVNPSALTRTTSVRPSLQGKRCRVIISVTSATKEITISWLVLLIVQIYKRHPVAAAAEVCVPNVKSDKWMDDWTKLHRQQLEKSPVHSRNPLKKEIPSWRGSAVIPQCSEYYWWYNTHSKYKVIGIYRLASFQCQINNILISSKRR